MRVFHSAVSGEIRKRDQAEKQSNEIKDQRIQIKDKVEEINNSGRKSTSCHL